MTRTPRQTPGEDCVPLTVLLPRPVFDAVTALAVREQRTKSKIGRAAIEAYVLASASMTAPPSAC